MHDNAGVAGDDFIAKRKVATQLRDGLEARGLPRSLSTPLSIRGALGKPKSDLNGKFRGNTTKGYLKSQV